MVSALPATAASREPTCLVQAMYAALEHAQLLVVRGRVKQVIGTLIRATAPAVRIGEICVLQTPGEPFQLQAEVIGFADGDVLLSPIGELQGISLMTMVVPTGESHCIGVGPHLLGQVLDGFGRPLGAGKHVDPSCMQYPVYTEAPNPLTRMMITQPLWLGVRVLDALLTCGEGQRMGIFAAAGGGKSTLLGMLARNTEADVIVMALIGERGREVREFLERDLGEQAMQRSVVVCATSERAPLERIKAAYVATTIAEYFRDQGQRVLFLMDSITRFARAQREIGLASGEPPTRRGFPPSVFASLPKLMERTGTNDKGSITAFYTVLVEGDDMNEPIADETRSILDGHIVLSRKRAAANHFPAVDVLASTSRLMHAIAQPEHRRAAGKLRELLAKYDEIEMLVRLGEYQQGNDPVADQALHSMDRINAFLRQDTQEDADAQETLRRMRELVE